MPFNAMGGRIPQRGPTTTRDDTGAAAAATRAQQVIYRPEHGVGMTDHEYAQRRQTAQTNAQTNANQALRQPQQYVGSGVVPPSVAAIAPAPQTQTQQRSDMRFESDLAMDTEARRAEIANNAMRERLGMVGEGPAPIAHPGATPESGESAVRAQAFSRAKDKAGQQTLASLKALEGVMAGRGMRGSTVEGNATADLLMGNAGEMNDVILQEAIADAERAEEVSDMTYQGGLQQRGQDLGMRQSVLALMGGRLY